MSGPRPVQTDVVEVHLSGASGGRTILSTEAYCNRIATLTLVSPRNWTEEGVTELSLWFAGDAANAPERMFIALNGIAVVYHNDPAAAQMSGWNEWVIPLQAFADQGVNLTNVNTITIGFGTKNSPAAGGTGKVYFDDIRLYRPRTAQ